MQDCRWGLVTVLISNLHVSLLCASLLVVSHLNWWQKPVKKVGNKELWRHESLMRRMVIVITVLVCVSVCAAHTHARTSPRVCVSVFV